MLSLGLTPNRPRHFWLVLATLALLRLALLPMPVEGQSAAAPPAATLQVVVCDSGGHPLSGATLILQFAGQGKALSARTDAEGRYRFAALRPGSYTLRAEMAGYSNTSSPLTLLAGRSASLKLTLAGAHDAKSGSLQFFDEPQFTIAGVTDPTSLGGHGSNASAPAGDKLAREVVSLGASSPAATKSAAQEQSLRSAVDRQPSDFDANRRLGRLLLDQGHPRQALPYLQQARRLKPADYQAGYDLALAYARAGEYEPARAALGSLPLAPDRAEVHRLLGNIAEKSGHPLDAVREYERAAQLAPTEPDFFDWGAELLLHRAPEPAIQVFAKGHHLFPNSARMLLGLGGAWFAQGSYQRAGDYFCQASDLDPAALQPYFFLGQLQEVEASPSAAIAQKLAAFVRRYPDNPQANYYYALSLWKQAHAAAAPADLAHITSLLQKAARLAPTFASAHLQLGILYADQKRYPEAIASYKNAIAADPQLPDAHYRLAQAYMRSGDQPKARSELRLYQELAKDNAQQKERERRQMQQFVYTLRGQSSAVRTR